MERAAAWGPLSTRLATFQTSHFQLPLQSLLSGARHLFFKAIMRRVLCLSNIFVLLRVKTM